jgi:cell division protein FtsL
MTANPARSEAAAPRLRVIQGKRLAPPTAWGWFIIALCAIAVFFGLIIANTALDRSAFELEEIRAEMTAEQQRFDRLRLDVAKLRSPERIQPLAEQLGLQVDSECITMMVGPGAGCRYRGGDLFKVACRVRPEE